jgi:hypothetical protein
MMILALEDKIHRFTKVPIAGLVLVGAIGVPAAGPYLLSHGTSPASLTRQATIGLTLGLLVGACAFIFALASCFG